MGVEIAEMAQKTVEVTNKENGKKDQYPGMKDQILFGSQIDEPAKAEGKKVAVTNGPKNAVNDWPEPTKIHYFYFVRYRTYEDPSVKEKIDSADKEVQKWNKVRFQLTEELRAKRGDRNELYNELKTLRDESKQYKAIMDEKKKEMEPLQHALGKLRNSNNGARSGGLCSSEEELNELIYSLQYRIQHEIIPLSEEKQILREIKQLEGTREKVIANVAMRAKIQDSLGQKEVIQDQVKLMGVDLDGVRKEHQAIWVRMKGIEEKMTALEEETQAIQEELTAVTDKRDKAFKTMQDLRKKRDEENAMFYQYRQVLNRAKVLAAKKDVKALENFSELEVDKFMDLWSSNKAVRDDYQKRILSSLDARQLSADGRIRNPDEKPLVEPPARPQPEPVVAKANTKKAKEEPKVGAAGEFELAKKVQKENIVAESKSKSKPRPTVEEDDFVIEEIIRPAAPVKKVDEAKLKEMKREEEITKAKQALERKRKLAEKAAAKAALKAQKEAEKKLKEREKKAKKKAGAFGVSEEPTEVEAADEPEKGEESVEAPVATPAETPFPAKGKGSVKEKNIKYRARTRGPEALPKAILKRKKSTNYWIWIAPAALVVLLSLVLVHFYLQ